MMYQRGGPEKKQIGCVLMRQGEEIAKQKDKT
jgi:hypothetical protein